MGSEDPPIDSLLQAVLDGESVDWVSAESLSEGPDKETVRQLKVLAGILGLHRGLSAENGEPVDESAADGLGRWGRLTLLERIGGGSFGEVFRAWDSKLDREVAVKLLRAAGEQSEGAVVLREARLLARVRHPNVVTVYDADEIEGRVGLWMEFIQGRNLEQILGERTKFDESEVTGIAIELCRALTAVHEAGLIHRDVKPQNLMQTSDGRLVLMDFGTGWELQVPVLDVDAAGTPLYLAPEIFEGARATVQSDIYSAGVVLFHLLTGAYPVGGTTVKEVGAAHASGDRLKLAAKVPGVTRTLAAVVDKATAPDPSERFESARQMLHALEEARTATEERKAGRRYASSARYKGALVATGFGLAILAGGVVAWLSRTDSAGATASVPLTFPARDLVLVASFENRTGEKLLDGTLDYALGLELSSSRRIDVVSDERIGNALRLMRKPADTPIDASVAREVCLRDGGIRALLTGRVERLGPQYLLSVELLDPKAGTTLAGFREESAGADGTLAAVRRVARRVQAALGEAPASEDAEWIPKVTTTSIRALQLYVRADGLVGANDDPAAAEELLRQAVAEDPTFAAAWIHLAFALHNQAKPIAEVRSCAESAFRLSETATERERYFIRGSYYMLLGEREKAIAAYEALLALYPEHNWAIQNLNNGLYDWKHNPQDLERAVEVEARRADALPTDFYANGNAGFNFTAMTPDPVRARPYLNRATELMKTGEGFSDLVPWLSLLPFTESWLKGDLSDASAEIDRVASTLDSLGGAARDQLAVATTLGYLTLGRMEAAEQTSAKIVDDATRNSMLVQIAFLRGDAPDLKDRLRLLRDAPPEDETTAILQARAHLLQDAKRFVVETELRRRKAIENPQRDPGFRRITDPRLHLVPGEIAMARGDLAGATAEFQNAMRLENDWFRMQPGFYLGAESLAAALTAKGDVKEAIEALEQASESKYQAVISGSSGPFWLRTRFELARAYAAAGRVEDARAVEADLRKLLALADPDHPILRELNRSRPS